MTLDMEASVALGGRAFGRYLPESGPIMLTLGLVDS
jgi:hypothetical protein